FYFCQCTRSVDDAVVRRLLLSARVGAGLAVDSCGVPRYLGVGGERNIFRRHVDPHPQPRDYAAALAIPDLDPGAAGDGRSNVRDSDWRVFGKILDRIACGL